MHCREAAGGGWARGAGARGASHCCVRTEVAGGEINGLVVVPLIIPRCECLIWQVSFEHWR